MRKDASVSGNDNIFETMKEQQSAVKNKVFGNRGSGIY